MRETESEFREEETVHTSDIRGRVGHTRDISSGPVRPNAGWAPESMQRLGLYGRLELAVEDRPCAAFSTGMGSCGLGRLC